MARRRSGPTRIALVAGAAVVVAAATVAVIRAEQGSSVKPGCTVRYAAPAGTYSFSTEQAHNASIISAVSFAKGMPDHAVTVALAAALQESGLRDLTYGDRDSVGLFQQRPSQGWGTRAQILQPAYAASAFFDRLAQVPGWQSMAVTDAAQSVEQSAAPSAYAAWEGQARALAIALTGESPAALSCGFAHFAGAPPADTALAGAMSSEMGSNLLGTPVSVQTGWRVAAWVVAHTYDYHVHSVSFLGRTWRPDPGTWTAGAGGTASQIVTIT